MSIAFPEMLAGLSIPSQHIENPRSAAVCAGLEYRFHAQGLAFEKIFNDHGPVWASGWIDNREFFFQIVQNKAIIDIGSSSIHHVMDLPEQIDIHNEMVTDQEANAGDVFAALLESIALPLTKRALQTHG